MKRNQVLIFELRERPLFTDAALQLGGKAPKSIAAKQRRHEALDATLNRLSDFLFGPKRY